jgi:hypothetical protein
MVRNDRAFWLIKLWFLLFWLLLLIDDIVFVFVKFDYGNQDRFKYQQTGIIEELPLMNTVIPFRISLTISSIDSFKRSRINKLKKVVSKLKMQITLLERSFDQKSSNPAKLTGRLIKLTTLTLSH